MDPQKAGLTGQYFFAKLTKLVAEDRPVAARIELLADLMRRFFVAMTEDSGLHFYTLFSRIAFAFQAADTPEWLQYAVQRFRRKVERYERGQKRHWSEPEWQESARAFAEAVAHLSGVPVPAPLDQQLPPASRSVPHRAAEHVADWTRVVLMEASEGLLHGIDEEGRAVRVGPRARYEDYFEAVQRDIERSFGFPVVVHLLDVVDEDAVWRPRLIVLEPDFLIDVTAVAECFLPDGVVPELNLVRRFLPRSTSDALILGTLANHMLDELVVDQRLEWNKEFMRGFFLLHPFAFAKMSDEQLKNLLSRAGAHFRNLQRVLRELPESDHGIEPAKAYLEPTFFSHIYGLQGRLDLLYRPTDDQTAIIELKSGGLYQPNAYGLNTNHFTQTLLYDLLVRSAFGSASNPRNYILYSRLDDQALRYAPRIETHQYDALQARNHLIRLERELSRPRPHQREADFKRVWHLLQQLHPDRFPNLSGFQRNDLMRFSRALEQLDPIEQRWFAAYVSFIAREHRYAKMGADGAGTRSGQASLWLSSLREKQERFEILNDLEIVENRADQDEPVLTFRKTEHTCELSNFRKGDIAVLYPVEEPDSHPLANQLFKCTVLAPGPDVVRVRLRARQSNAGFFDQFARWNLEPDLLDSSFVSLYRSLFAFAEADKDKRALWLGRRAPRKGEPAGDIQPPAGLTREQQEVFRQGLEAGEVFLLWGPPGTGKTSRMLHAWVAWLLRHTDEHFMLLAYTNRAVDEICEAIGQIGPEWLPEGKTIEDCYLRVGSKYATDPKFHSQLLSERLKTLGTRAELVQLLQERRIIVSTVSTMMNRPELFGLKQFQRVIIDEASQLTEPMLAGLLPRFERVMLIGDHKQLPAVVSQPEHLTRVQDARLSKLGLKDLGNSLFERLFVLYQQKGQHHAFAKLTRQGRMHAELMAFANEAFYEGNLRLLPEGVASHARQVCPLERPIPEKNDPLAVALATQRLIFIPTEPAELGNSKQNEAEAEAVRRIIRTLKDMYGSEAAMPSLGVITPYRAQIAAIRRALSDTGLQPDRWTIDTVERYQGGARDIIILSLCTNSLQQLDMLMHLNDEGVDRKLNVAVTRAREQMIVVGAEEILSAQSLYADLLRRCHRVEI